MFIKIIQSFIEDICNLFFDFVFDLIINIIFGQISKGLNTIEAAELTEKLKRYKKLYDKTTDPDTKARYAERIKSLNSELGSVYKTRKQKIAALLADSKSIVDAEITREKAESTPAQEK